MTAGPEPIAAWWLAAACVVALSGAACDDDPMAADPVCGQEPAIAVGDTVDGTLTDGDRRFDGAFIDYYSLQLNASVRLTLTLVSTEMDPLLFVFNAPGDVAEQAFEPFSTAPGEEETASITRDFTGGCHLIGASAFTPDTTGAYTLTVDSAVVDTAAAR